MINKYKYLVTTLEFMLRFDLPLALCVHNISSENFEICSFCIVCNFSFLFLRYL